MKNSFRLQIAECFFEINPNFPETEYCFEEYLRSEDENKRTVAVPKIPMNRLQFVKDKILNLNSDDRNSWVLTEYHALSMSVYNQCLRIGLLPMHALCFKIRSFNRSVVLSAPSGTGKTTQFMNWKSLFPEEIEIINGDVSLIDMTSGTNHVFNSPWCGKEGFHNHISAPLGSFIYLEQGSEDRICELSIKEKIQFLYPQVLYLSESEQDIDLVCGLLTKLFRSVRVYKFVNTGTYESTMKLREFIYEELGQN